MDTKDIFTKTFQRKQASKPIKEIENSAPKTSEKPMVAERKKKAEALPKREARASASMFDSENIVRAIHKAKEENQRITVDVPVDIYKRMKVYLAHENVSIRDFVVRLIDVYLTKNEVR